MTTARTRPTTRATRGSLTGGETFAAVRDEIRGVQQPLPDPLRARVRPEDPPRQELFDQNSGLAVHALVALLMPQVHGKSATEIADWIFEHVGAATRDLPNVSGRSAALRQRVSGLTAIYMRDLAPPPPAVLLGSEQPTLSGARVDLVWQWPDQTVLYDEIKTWRTAKPDLDTGTIAQIKRYLADGIAEHGDMFAGVRLLPLCSVGNSRLFTPDGRSLSLATTPFATGWGVSQ